MRRIYRLLLKLYPSRFREEFAGSLEHQFADEYRDATSTGERWRLLLRTLFDLLFTIPAEVARETAEDLRYAARVYRKRALSTILAFSALALAIGATTGVFSVVNALLIRSLPFRQPGRLVHMTNTPVSPFDGRAAYFAWRDSATYLEDAAAYFPEQMNLGQASRSSRIPIAEVSANFFGLLGSQPVLGRAFAADEDLPGHDNVAVIGYALWQQFFGGDPRVLGATIHLNGIPITVVGIAPATLDFPSQTAVWTPTLFDREHLPKEGVLWGETVARLKPGVTITAASQAFDAQMRQTTQQAPAAPLLSLQDQLAGPVRQASLVLMGLVAFVLLIACANVAHILLSRTAERRQELAIRTALGASRARLVQQLITESGLLTLLAAVAGLAVAEWASRLAAAAQPAKLTVQDYSILDWRVLGFAAGTAALTGVVFGVLPAALIGRLQPGAGPLRSRGTGGPNGAGRMRVVLLAVQGALTLVLLAGSLTMGRSFLRLLHTDLGFRSDRVVTLNVAMAGTRWESDSHSGDYERLALEKLRAIPGVESAAAVDYLPLTEHMYMAGSFAADAGHSVSAVLNGASPQYFRTMSTRILEGRDFEPNDDNDTASAAIVNREFVKQLGLGPHVVGLELTAKWPRKRLTIVGVVETAVLQPGSKPLPQVFLPIHHFGVGWTTFIAHVDAPAEPFLPICRGAVQQVDPQVPVYDVKTLGARLSDHLARPRFYTTAVLFFAGFALLLAVVGIYGAASYSVAQRTHEIGVRMAVGATPGRLRGQMLWRNLLPMLYGGALGIAGAAMMGRYLQHMIDGADTTGVYVCLLAAVALIVSVALAVWVATRKITAMDPTTALRTE